MTTGIDDKPQQETELPLGPGAAATRTEPGGSPDGQGATADAEELRQAVQTELQQLKEAARFATPERALQVLEALFFAAEKPLDLAALEDTTQFERAILQNALQDLKKLYPADGARGGVLVDLGGGWQLRTDAQSVA